MSNLKNRVKNFIGRAVAVVLSAAMLGGFAEAGTSVAAAGTVSKGGSSGVSTNNDISINSTNSFGDLISKEISDEDIEESETVGYKIFTAEVTGNKVSVEFQTLEPGTLVAAIYDESGTTLISTGKTDISAEDTTAGITLDTNSMPKYFYLRVFLVDTTTLRPMCKVYDCPNYTKEMQEFLAKTTDDFESDSVLNLDNDKTNNFAVYSDETKVIPESKTKNKVVSADDERGIYVFENIDSNISSLKSGDVFAYEYGDDNLIIVKVGNITINGTKATVTSRETSMDEVFDYVKIDEDADTSEVTVDDSELEEGITYEGKSSESGSDKGKSYNAKAYSNSGISTTGMDIGGTVSESVKFDVAGKKIGSDDKYVKVSAKIDVKMGATMKLYITKAYQYFEFGLDYSTKISLALEMKSKFPFELPLAKFGFAICPGLYVELTPSIVVEASVSLEVSGTLEGGIGFRVSNSKGLENTSKTPSFKPEFKIEGTVFIGLSLEPKVKVLSEYIAEVSVDATAGVEVKASFTVKPKEKDVIHECKKCIDGDISFKMTIDIKVKLLNMKKLTFDFKVLGYTAHLCDFYWSLDFGEFGFKKCPHKKYRLEIKTVDQSKTPVVGAFVEVNGETHTTDSNGEVVVEIPANPLSIIAYKDGIGYAAKYDFNIEYDKKSITMVLSLQDNLKFNWNLSSGNFESPSTAKGNWAYVTTGSCTNAAIDKQGNLYMWGANWYGQIGDGTKDDLLKPKKIMSNITSVIIHNETTAAIDKFGNLYMWGRNDYGQVGDGTTTNCLKPKMILSDIVSVSLDDNKSLAEVTTAAIDKSGNLYMWGGNVHGQIGDGTKTDCFKPKKIMSNITSVITCDQTTAAIDKSGNLYMWGANGFGQIGDGTETDCFKPKKIMSNITSVITEWHTTAAIDKFGNLYMWGLNDNGQIGGETRSVCLKPKKIMSNIASVSRDSGTTAVIDKLGNLYMFGDNYYGQIGDGTRNDCYKPKKIMSNIASVIVNWSNAVAIDKLGNLYMWGANGYGQIGDGTGNDCYKPKKIMSNVVYGDLDSACVCTIDKSGNLYMWGQSAFGGEVWREDRYTPTLIPYPTDTSKILNTKAQPIATVKATSANTKTKQFTSLTPNCTYNFYVVQTRDTKDILSDDNLLYISQATADENGKLTVTYDTAKGFEREECFVIQAQQTDIANAEIKIDSITANGTEQSVEPIVTVDGETLMNGIDYDLAGDFKVKETGEYTITVLGTGMYKGEKTVSFKVIGEEPKSIKLNKTSITLEKGKSEKLTATITPNNAANKSVTWTSSDAKVATVSNGTVKAVAAGTATITAKTSNGKTATCKVTVKNPVVAVTGIKLNKTSITIEKGKSEKLMATISPNNSTNKSVTWTSSDTKVATVSNGTVKAVAAGTATITAKTSNGKTATCKVTVKNPVVAVTGIKLNKTSINLEKGKTTTLTATISPSNATNKTLKWTSSNTKVATVSNGKITAKAAGTATITAQTANGKKATCKVTVNNPKTVNPTSVKLSKTSVTLYKGKTTTLKATVNPSNATNKKVTWKTSNSKVATVSNGKITAKAAGTATITVQTANGKKATCKVTVKNPKTVNPTSVKLSKMSVTLYKGKTTTLKATVNPSNATNKKVTWKTSNSKVATVSNGKITAKAIGTAIITAQTTNGKKATCKVTVKNPKTVNPTSVKLSKTSVTLGKGKTTTLKATVNLSNATNKKVTWKTSNSKVATVSNGKITAKSTGTATITVQTANGKKATCRVTVKSLPTSVKLNTASATLAKGKTLTLKATVTPSKNVINTVTWSTSDSKVATVKNGKVTAKAKGTATITVKTSNGKTAKCKITVK